METLLQDLRYGTRVLWKSPAYTAVAVIVLALGIGANTAIFSVVNAVLLRPLPFPEAERLVQVWHVPPQKSFPGATEFAVSAANYLDWKERNHSFEQLSIYSFRGFNVTGTDHPEAVQAAQVSADFFATLRQRPIIGRPFMAEDDQPGHGNVVILSSAYWKSHMGADPNVVGRELMLDGEKYSIVGVMDANSHIPSWAEMWAPMAWTSTERAVRSEHHYMVIGRLKPGVDVKQAQAEMTGISTALELQYPQDDKGWGAVVLPLREQFVRDVRPSLLMLLGAVAFVLLIACANVANLALAKTLGRSKEIAIRSALGASRGRVLQQFLAETVVLALGGGLLGLALAHFGVRLIVAFLGSEIPTFAVVQLDPSVLMFTLAVSVLAGILAGIAPAWRSTRANLNDALKQGLGRTDSASTGSRTRKVLVIAEVSLSLMLLIGAGLLMRSLSMLRTQDPGFDVHNLLTMYLPVAGNRFSKPEQQIAYFDQVVRRVEEVPGVESASMADNLPLSEDGSNQPIVLEGQPAGPLAEQPEVAVRVVSSGYFRDMRIPMLQGRDFGTSDTTQSKPVIVISKAMARRFWGNENPIGKRLTMSFFPGVVREVIGVVGDVKLYGLSDVDPSAVLYFPHSQIMPDVNASWHSFDMTLVVRTQTNPGAAAAAVSHAVHEIDSAQPIADVMTMEDVEYKSITPQRFNMLLLASFAGLALLLAAVGIYSVLSYGVRRRVREIGIRMALGARVQDVLRMVVIEGMRPTLVGVGIGLAGALLLGRLLQSLIYGIKTSDPVTFGAVSLLLASVALLACMIPAYRASKVEPMSALRDE